LKGERKENAFFLLAPMRLRGTGVSTPPTTPPEGAVGALRSTLCSRGKKVAEKVAEKVVAINRYYLPETSSESKTEKLYYMKEVKKK